MNKEMYTAPEAVKIMKGMPGTYKQTSQLSDNAWASIQAFCEDAQISLINHHIPRMDIRTRRRAEQVKAGTYRGLAVK